MYTLCPSCKTIFGINAQQLAAAQGRVRCGVCRAAFSALDNLSEQPDDLLSLPVMRPQEAQKSLRDTPTPPEAVSIRNVPQEQAPDPTQQEPDIINAPPMDGLVLRAQDAQEQQPPMDGLVLRAHDAQEQPSSIVAEEPLAPDPSASSPNHFAATPKRISLAATLTWSVANLALMAVLVIQFAYFNRDDLVRYTQWRPALEKMCHYAGCVLPLQSDITKITLINRELRSHPRVDNALLVTATLVNKASFPQPYPMLQLSLSDFSGRTVAMRRFQPTEYVGNAGEINGGMRPGQPIEISLELADPGKAAVGFEFTFI